MLTPPNLFYTEAHVWVKEVEDGLLTGITDHAQESLGEIQYLELPAVGDKLVKDTPFGTVETSKSVSDLIAPLDATISEVNEQLDDAPDMINDSPYESGWILRLTDYNAEDLKALLDSEAYDTYID